MEGEEANLPVPAVTTPVLVIPSSSSSLSSSPGFLRHVQAAFKRHRPLVAMHSNSIRPRRILVPQREACRNSREFPPPNTGEEAKGNLVSYMENSVSAPEQLEPHSSALCAQGVVTTLDECPDPSDGQKPESNPVEGNPEIPTASSHRESWAISTIDCAGDAFATEKVAMDSNIIRPRVLIPLCEASENSRDFPPPNTVSEMKGDLAPYMENPVSARGQSDIPSSALCAPGVATTLDESPDPYNEQKPESSLIKGNPEIPTISSHQDSCHVITEKETYRDPGPESSSYVTDQVDGLIAVNPEAGVSSGPTDGADGCRNGDPLHLKNHTRSSTAVGSSSATTTVNSSSAPAAITTDSSISFQNDPSHGSRLHPPPPKCGEAISLPDSRVPAARFEKPEPQRGAGKQEKGDGNRGTHQASARKKGYDPDMFFKVNGKLYQKLGKIGSGGSSEVHKVISSDCSIYALKKIKLKGRDYGTAYGFCQEIEYLNRLKGKKHIIQLIDYEVTDKALLEEVVSGTMSGKENKVKNDGYIYMVLEYGEIDLAHMLSQKWKELDDSGLDIDENWLRFFWQQILMAVNTIHQERIVHSDLKPANFLLVKGSLKLIDFGIAKAIMNDTTNIQRDSQVGTLSYMSPEAFMCNERDEEGKVIKCGRASDIWSVGCILYQMVYGRTPFSDYKTFWAKFKAVTDRNHRIHYGPPLSNPSLLHLLSKCLSWDPSLRWRIPDLLLHPFILPPPLPPPPPHLPLSPFLLRLHSLLSSSPLPPSLLPRLHLLLSLLSDFCLRLDPPLPLPSPPPS